MKSLAWMLQIRRYSSAAGMAGLALLTRALLNPLLDKNDPYVPLFAAVAFIAWYMGSGPAILTTSLGALGTLYWFIDPPDSIRITTTEDAFGLLVFVGVSGAITAVGQGARQTAAQLRQAERNLEIKVQIRTNELTEANQKLQQANEKLHELSQRILQTQDEERRDVARELHDSVGQLLVALKMNHDLAQMGTLSPELAKLMADSGELLDRVLKEIRTLTYLLHPPSLDDIGLRSALERLVTGFSERSRVAAHLDISPNLPRFQRDLELSVFRIVQECLTNIHKHSQAKTATIRLNSIENTVVLTVRDDGVGVREPYTAGIGLRGMRERALQLGGTFDVESSRAGTTVTATFPIPETQQGRSGEQGQNR